MILSLVLVSAVLSISACGDNGGAGGASSGTWVGEVYASAGSKESTVVGEFGSYDECIAATMAEAKSGVFNCGIK